MQGATFENSSPNIIIGDGNTVTLGSQEKNVENQKMPETDALVKAVEADEENLKRSEESGDDRHAPAETIVIDKMALAEAFRKQEQEAYSRFLSSSVRYPR